MFPSSVATMHERQTPYPQAIVFSRETSQSTFWLTAMAATARIIGSGPQVYILVMAGSIF
jgi:hypothetical protein